MRQFTAQGSRDAARWVSVLVAVAGCDDNLAKTGLCQLLLTPT
jgi:hypothetical protein